MVVGWEGRPQNTRQCSASWILERVGASTSMLDARGRITNGPLMSVSLSNIPENGMKETSVFAEIRSAKRSSCETLASYNCCLSRESRVVARVVRGKGPPCTLRSKWGNSSRTKRVSMCELRTNKRTGRTPDHSIQ